MSSQWRRFVEHHPMNDYARALCNQCFYIDPARRPTPTELLNKHPYFSVASTLLVATRKAPKDSKLPQGSVTGSKEEQSIHLSQEKKNFENEENEEEGEENGIDDEDDDNDNDDKNNAVIKNKSTKNKTTMKRKSPSYKAELINEVEPKNSHHYSVASKLLHSRINKALTTNPEELSTSKCKSKYKLQSNINGKTKIKSKSDGGKSQYISGISKKFPAVPTEATTTTTIIDVDKNRNNKSKSAGLNCNKKSSTIKTINKKKIITSATTASITNKSKSNKKSKL